MNLWVLSWRKNKSCGGYKFNGELDVNSRSLIEALMASEYSCRAAVPHCILHIARQGKIRSRALKKVSEENDRP